MSKPLLIYGANGFTGRLIVQLAVSRGLRPIVAGRSAGPIHALAERHDLESRVFGLGDGGQARAALDGVGAVLHCAGPFVHTHKTMVDACMESGAHYLDITGEVEVFEALRARDEEARAAGVLLLPGVGFDVVPSDCLAVYLAGALPDASRLTLAILGLGSISHGTARTVAENLGRGAAVREGGRLKSIALGTRRRSVDFGPVQCETTAIAWGDLSTAYRSTGIPNIEVYMGLPKRQLRSLAWVRALSPVLSSRPIQGLIRARIDATIVGPDEEQRAASRGHLWGEAAAPDGRTVSARLHTPDGYDLTADAAVTIASRVLAGEGGRGFQTPGLAFGPDLVLQLNGVEREELQS
ncbi:MAG TPA: saccharopine dehydrogenase, partial [Deltaproteobacteria bacterium]|nr:saccharopine dehydrogenase [Deltaproteobacteria bacterium]